MNEMPTEQRTITEIPILQLINSTQLVLDTGILSNMLYFSIPNSMG